MDCYKKTWLVAICVIIVFVAGVTYVFGLTNGKVCPKCDGSGKTRCTSCNGIGTCGWCGGSGRNRWFNPDELCPLCHGSGRCTTCDGTGYTRCRTCSGSGWYWMFTSVGSSLLFSTIFSLCFFGAFGLEYAVDAFRLDMNPWVFDVKDMDFWFNPMFLTWLFGRDRRRWAKWTTASSLIVAVILGTTLAILASIERATRDVMLIGCVFGMTFTILLGGVVLYYGYWKHTKTETNEDSLISSEKI